ncbi:MAG: hypothetical protein J5962_02455 [Lachnospiraceae bacterium]|nr:hypothetical protein [Lachnospiraceae bacterium]
MNKNNKMNKMSVVLCVAIMLAMLVFTGCGSAKGGSDKRFTYDWKLYSITSGGTTMTYSENDPLAPAFSSSDGITCTLTNKGKAHQGTIEHKEGNLYIITLNDSDTLVEAEISDDTLTITLGGKMVLVYKTAKN